MTHPGYAEMPLDYVATSRASVPLPWLGFAVALGFMALSVLLDTYDTLHQQAMAPIAAWWAIEVLACAAALAIPGVPRQRRLVALAIFVGGLALQFVTSRLHPPGIEYISYALGPAVYAAGWITMRHVSRWALVAVALAPIMTAVLGPLSPIRGGTGQLFGAGAPFEVFIALHVFSVDILPTVVAVVIARAIAQEAREATADQAALRRWPCWIASVALVAALAGVVVVAVPTGLPILAIVLGHVGSSAVKRKGLGGRSFAVTAYVLGYLEVVVFVWSLYVAFLNWKFTF